MGWDEEYMVSILLHCFTDCFCCHRHYHFIASGCQYNIVENDANETSQQLHSLYKGSVQSWELSSVFHAILDKPSLETTLTTLVLIYSFQLPSDFQLTVPLFCLVTYMHSWKCIAFCEFTRDLELWPMTLIFERGLHRIELKTTTPNVLFRQTHNRLIALCDV